MPRTRLLVLCVLTACLAVPALPATPASADTTAEELMLKKVNSFRKHYGIRGVRLSRSLRDSAERYAWRQMRNGYFGHSSRIHASSSFRRLGEILEWHSGLKARVDYAFGQWKRSSGHRRIMLDRGFRWAGAGRASGKFRGRNATIWVMHFGTK